MVRARRVSAGLLAALAGARRRRSSARPSAPGGIAFGFRNPDAARYLYPGAVLALLVLVELVALRRRRAAARGSGAWSARRGRGRRRVRDRDGLQHRLSSLTAPPTTGSRQASSSAAVGAFDLAREGRSPGERAAELGESVEQSAGWLALMLEFSDPEGVDKVVLGAPAYYAIQDAYGLSPFDESVLDRASPA